MEPMHEPGPSRVAHSATSCRQCGCPLNPAWDFCGHCGAQTHPMSVVPANAGMGAPDASDRAPNIATELVPTTTSLSETSVAAPARRRFGWLDGRRAMVAAIGLVMVVVLVVGTVVELGTRHRLSATRARLATTQTNLSATRSDLTATSNSLKARTTERDALQSKVDTLNTQLQGVQGSLNDAKANLNSQSNQITVLKSCLSGVMTALVAVGNGDYNGAVGALQSVDSVCRQASQYM